MSDNNDLTPEERALREMDNQPKESSQEKQGISDLENAATEAPKEEPKIKSLGKIERADYTKESVEQTELKHGFFSVDVTEFPSKGRFYPRGTKVRIKSATVKDIRTFSALDEENPYEVDEALVDLLSNCVRVSFPSKVASWKDILEEDRLSLILSIRQLTFAEGENKISFKVKCESCNTENDMEIINENFQKRELNEKIAKYYSDDTRRFDIETKTYGIINMRPPTIGIMRVINKYIKSLQENKENVKEYLPFLKTVPYMVEEWRGFSIDDMSNYRIEFIRWNEKKFLTFTKLVELAAISVKEKMLKPCTKCGDPIEANIELPTGIKGLFIEEGILDDELM
tara:strand:- start:12315 stop:13340 length:1026 start_codon:yes stop_codon:yes gene_type:complete